MRNKFLLLIFFSLFALNLQSQESVKGTSHLDIETPFKPMEENVITAPYAPLKRDYSFELGGAWQESNYYYLGGLIGFNIGECRFYKDPSCQQYFDVTSGIAAKSAHTHAIWSAGLRYQLVQFPKTYSPFFRVFGGGMVTQIVGQDFYYRHLGGVGFGIISSLHEQVDLRIEGRLGYSNQSFGMLVIGGQLKIDKLITYFADKLQEFGIDTVEATGNVVNEAGELGGKAIKGAGDLGGKAIDKTKKALSRDKEEASEKSESKQEEN
jgi:hypothetical protein